MARMHLLGLVGIALLIPSFAIYEDQVGQVDWKHDHIGIPTSSLYFSKHVFVVTDQGVLASLDARTGDIEWRHLMAKGGHGKTPIEHLQFSGTVAQTSVSEVRRNLLTVSKGSQGRRLQMWRSDGSLLWDEPTIPLSSGGDSKLSMGNYISLLSENAVNVFSATGNSVWQLAEFDLTEVTGEGLELTDIFQVDDNTVGVVGSQSATMVVLHLNVKAKSLNLVHRIKSELTAPFLLTTTEDGSRQHVAAVTDHVLHCFEMGKLKKTFQIDLSASLKGEIIGAVSVAEGSEASVLSVEIITGSKRRFVAMIVNASNEAVVVGGSSEQIAATTAKGKVFVANIDVNSVNSNFSLVESSGTHPVMKGVAPIVNLGPLGQVWPFITEKRDGELFFRVLVTTESDDVVLMQPEKANWVREEAMAAVKNVVFVGQRLSDVSNTQVEYSGELSDWQARWKHQAARLSEVAHLEAVGKDGLTTSLRHKFGFDKDAICLTECGKLLSLSLDTGRVHWSRLLIGGNHRLLASREHPHGSHSAEVVILSDNQEGKTHASFIDASDGSETSARDIPIDVGSVTTLGDADGHGRSSLLLIEAPQTDAVPLACLLMDSAEGRKKVIGSFFHHLDQGFLRSFQITGSARDNCFLGVAIGASDLGEGNVLAVAYPSSLDKVNAPAQILGDDSLLLKYTNSHLMVAMTASSGGLAVSLLDTVAGKVLHRVFHANSKASSPGSDKPSLVLSENLVVYSFWNEKAKRSEIGVLSLYEGMVGAYDMNPFKIPLQDPFFSSFNAKAPVVMQRTFISPKSIKHLSATVTAQGISTKNILAVFDGGQIAMIPRRMLDPRRPNTPPSKPEMEEGLFQYHPHLFLDPRGYITMNQTSLGADHVYLSSAIIESATIVLATGIDTFFTRATPSKTFDLLAADFNHSFLVALLGGLFLATVVLRKFDQDKKLNSAWR